MAGTTVYRSYEVRTGFGPLELGGLELETTSRFEADQKTDDLWTRGQCVQLFGIKQHDNGERVLLRSLVARRAA